MRRRLGGPASAALAGLLIAVPTATGASASWQPISGGLPGVPADAISDGRGALVATLQARRLVVTRVQAGRVGVPRRLTGAIRGTSGVRLLPLPGRGALVIWNEVGPRGWIIRASRRAGPRSLFTRPSIVAPRGPGEARSLSVARGPDGRVHAAWWSGPSRGPYGIFTAVMSADGVWSNPVEVSAGPGGAAPASPSPLGRPVIAVGQDGGLAITWGEVGGSGAVRVAVATPAEAWSEPTVVAPARSAGPWPLAVSSGAPGEFILAWGEDRDPGPDGVTRRTCLVAARIALGATRTDDLECLPSRFSGPIRLARTSDGGTVAAWQTVTGTAPLTAAIRVRVRAPGFEAWQPPREVVDDARGFEEIAALAPSRGGVLLGSALSVRRTAGPAITAFLLSDDGTPRRLPSPLAPTRVQQIRVLPLAQSRGQALASWTTPGGRPGAALLTLPPVR